jgi:hypothetical protein
VSRVRETSHVLAWSSCAQDNAGRGPSITEVGDEPLEGQIFNVLTLRDGRIVRIEDFRGRSEALAAAGVSEDVGCC